MTVSDIDVTPFRRRRPGSMTNSATATCASKIDADPRRTASQGRGIGRPAGDRMPAPLWPPRAWVLRNTKCRPPDAQTPRPDRIRRGGGLLLATIVLLVFVAAIMRFFDHPLIWSVDMAQLLFIWLCFSAPPAPCAEGGHIGIDSWSAASATRYRLVVETALAVIVLVFLRHLGGGLQADHPQPPAPVRRQRPVLCLGDDRRAGRLHHAGDRDHPEHARGLATPADGRHPRSTRAHPAKKRGDGALTCSCSARLLRAHGGRRARRLRHRHLRLRVLPHRSAPCRCRSACRRSPR